MDATRNRDHVDLFRAFPREARLLADWGDRGHSAADIARGITTDASGSTQKRAAWGRLLTRLADTEATLKPGKGSGADMGCECFRSAPELFLPLGHNCVRDPCRRPMEPEHGSRRARGAQKETATCPCRPSTGLKAAE